MKKMSKVLALVIALVMALTMIVACGGKSGVEKIKEAGKLTMLTNAAFAPYEYLGENDEISGVDVEIAKAIAEELGVELEIINMDFDGIISAVQTGKGDLGIAGITANEERAKSVAFSINYVDTAQYLIVSEANAAELEGKTDAELIEWLAGKNIGVQSGTTGHFFVEDSTDATAVIYKTAPDAAIELANGKLDGVVIDEMPAQQLVTANEGLVVMETPLTTEQYAIAIAKENEDLKEVVDSVLEKLIAEGKIEAWIEFHKEASAGIE
ncbi:MAG: transporter substrate-binding domain-containing protein [Christensenellaceae bacterium]|nr:transporter substrate-binding domain-containing protein [Christensenellaceae bacterium]